MREILFRGKRRTGGWVVGNYLSKPILEQCFILQGENQWMVLPETVGQYTGLMDKNGKKIFEGDIVQHLNDNPYADESIVEMGSVFWDEEYCGWRRTSNGEFYHGKIDTYRLSKRCCNEVIGNVHDNPELIGGADDAVD